jgi:hypothetical protein
LTDRIRKVNAARIACGKLVINPKKPHEKAAIHGLMEANKYRRPAPPPPREFACRLLIINNLFMPRFVLDTPFPRTYYAARKF